MHADTVVHLRAKALAVLRHLAERPGRLVSKEELFAAVWPDASVSDVVLNVCVREVRQALGDDAKAPRFIETVHRRGYRFIARITDPPAVTHEEPPHPPLVTHPAPLMTRLVGRDAELAQLVGCFERATRGRRQILFMIGEAGVGKTTLADAFTERIDTQRGTAVLVAHGRCMESSGTSEPFGPVLEALGRLCRQPHGAHLLGWLHEHAPSWLLQLPGLIAPAEREALQRAYANVTHERMLREMVVGVEMLTGDTPLVLVLEDLHWSDASTLDLIAALAHRHQPARLLVLGTYRPVDVILAAHPLKKIKQELTVRRLCSELALEPLCVEAVAEYLAIRFQSRAVSPSVAAAVHHHTGGNPLFLLHVTDHLLAQRLDADALQRPLHPELAALLRGLPQGLRELIQRELDELSATEHRLLDAASVVGVELSAEAVAAALGTPADEVEADCNALAQRRRFLRALDPCEWPDGTHTGMYRFAHPLYREVLYDRLPPARRRRHHQDIGERLERGYGMRSEDIAGVLAAHFEAAGDAARAVHYHQIAGQAASTRHADHEALTHWTAAVILLAKLPATAERDRRELALLVNLRPLTANLREHTAPEVERIYTRARALC